jgi:hypothetical protein
MILVMQIYIFFLANQTGRDFTESYIINCLQFHIIENLFTKSSSNNQNSIKVNNNLLNDRTGTNLSLY